MVWNLTKNQSILLWKPAMYRQDFEKYARKAQVKYLGQLVRQIPHLVGKEFSYREIHGEYRKRELASVLDLYIYQIFAFF